MAREKRAFMSHEYGPPSPQKSLKFAVLDQEERAISSVWTVFPAHNPNKPDCYVTSSGLQNSMKFSFHEDVLQHSILGQSHSQLVEAGLAPQASRHMLRQVIPGLPWHGLTIHLYPELLRKTGIPLDELNGNILALPRPQKGTVLEVAFVLTTGNELTVQGAQFMIGQANSRDRKLVVVGRYRAIEEDRVLEDARNALSKIPMPETLPDDVRNGKPISCNIYGLDEAGFMTVTEIHNVIYRPPLTSS